MTRGKCCLWRTDWRRLASQLSNLTTLSHLTEASSNLCELIKGRRMSVYQARTIEMRGTALKTTH
jgi:hypothetical protein